MSPRARRRKPSHIWDGTPEIRPGTSADLELTVGESYSGMNVRIPIHVKRALEEGPSVLVTAALHGDEINGTGAVRQLITRDLTLLRGTLILVPVLNVLAFERHSRYLPDRRDLNRSFRGSKTGSLASRMARIIFDEILSRADFAIDLHTAAVHRTNYPSIRADMSQPRVKELALAFGAELILNKKGPRGALRREACLSGCPTIVLEGGEVWKVEPFIVGVATRGIQNVLRSLEMLDGPSTPHPHPLVVHTTKWIRAEHGGFLKFHIAPGDLVKKGQALATNTSLLGREQGTLHAPFDAIVAGLATLPSTSPGEPICNLAKLPEGTDFDALAQTRAQTLGNSM